MNDNETNPRDNIAMEKQRGRLLFVTLLAALLLVLLLWIRGHTQWSTASAGPATAAWIDLASGPPGQWLDWSAASLIGALLYALTTIGSWYFKPTARFRDFTLWYISTIIKGPIIAVIILLFLTSVSIEIAGLDIDFTQLSPPVLLVAAFTLGFYNRVARAQLDQIVKSLFGRAFGATEETFAITPGKTVCAAGETVQFQTRPQTDVVWLASAGQITDGRFTAPSNLDGVPEMNVVITAVPTNQNIPRATAQVTVQSFRIHGPATLRPGAQVLCKVSPETTGSVTWSVLPADAGAAIDETGLLTSAASAGPADLTVTATQTEEPHQTATTVIHLETASEQ